MAQFILTLVFGVAAFLGLCGCPRATLTQTLIAAGVIVGAIGDIVALWWL